MRLNRTRTVPALHAAAAGLLALGVALTAPAAFADDERVTDEQFAKVKAALESKGYSDVRDVEIDDGRFEADALHRDGYKVDLELDMSTLEVVHEKRD